MNNHEPPTHLDFCLLHCCTAKAISSRSSTCIYIRESRSPKPSSSSILHQERVNMVFGKRFSQLLARFFKFFITTRLPLHRTCTKGRCFQCELRQDGRHLHSIVIVKEPQVTYGFSFQIMSYILNMLIWVGIILLDNLLQCLLFNAMIDLCRTYNNIVTLICNALVMFMIYS
jgi:hypothetical protein